MNGYTHDEAGHLVINEVEAVVVRLIYKMSTERESFAKISARLKDLSILSLRGKDTRSRETLRKILGNEKYRGAVVLQKTFVGDFLDHKQMHNDG